MRSKLIIILGLILSLCFTFSVLAKEDEELLDPDIPKSWFEAPKLASEMEIDKFNQSPMFDQRVEEGDLPPVTERLPEDPPAIEPYNEIGEYGGTANTWGTSLDSWFGTESILLQPFSHLGRATPDGTQEVPYLARDWEYSEDYKTLTLYLREGLKWSDGEPFNADDYMYWYEHVALNEDLSPVPPEEWKPVALLNVTAPDKHTVKFHFDKPNPTRHQEFHIWCWWGATQPEHHMKQFHPDFVDEKELEEKAEEAGLDTWFEYYGRMSTETHPDRARPTLRPYVAVERTETYLLAERNPYYPFVDSKGNQLPYIDKLRLNLVNEEEMGNTKAATGEATIAGNHTKTVDIPLYKRNEVDENYKTLLYNSGRGSALAIMLNLSHQDEAIRDVFQDFRFRKAVSYAINRENINRKVFHERAVPRQATVIPTSKYFEPEFAEAYAEYDIERARELLDEMGMEDTDGDGFREFPDGESFTPQINYCEHEGPRTEILELVKSDLEKAGINVELKMVSRELLEERKSANNFDIGEWHIDRVTDVLLPRAPSKTFAPTNHIPHSPWPGWTNWYTTGGKEGQEPISEAKKVIEYHEEMVYSTNEEERIEAGKKMIKAQADNLWTIGTVGMIPWPVIVSEDLKNVPETGIWTDDLQYMDPLYPIQFYLDE